MLRLSIAAVLSALVLTLPAAAGAPRVAELFPSATVVKVFMYESGEAKLDARVMRDFKTVTADAVPSAGVALDTAQVAQVKRAFTRATGDQAIGACFFPRHGFVFEDAAGKVVGTLDVCFECSNYIIDAPGYREKEKAIYDRHKQPDGDWDEKVARKAAAEVDRLRADYNMPATGAPIDWKGLAALVEAANMPTAPKPADYARLRGGN
jgi:hypothetical protein